MPSSRFVATASDPAAQRKSRGAFYTDDAITRHIADWAIQGIDDSVLEPSAGEAAFLTAAVHRLQSLGKRTPTVHGVEIFAPAAEAAERLVRSAGGLLEVSVRDFFLSEARPLHDAVIGNPPFIRYQDWSGSQRDRARFAALQQGVALTGLASSWAPFVVHAAAHLKPGGRLGMVLPAELLTVNYASAVRRFLLEHFESVELVVFEEQVFPDAEADTVLVKAAGWMGEPSGTALLRQTRNASTLKEMGTGTTWASTDPDERWVAQPLQLPTQETVSALLSHDHFVPLDEYGDTSLGAVTGANKYFTLSPERVGRLGIPRRDLVKISPPGSSHLRNLAFTGSGFTRVGQAGQATWLLYPSSRPAPATLHYLAEGENTGVAEGYKCSRRRPWWRVPLLAPPDLFLTYMNADTARLSTNEAGARHLNSVHGVYLREEVRDLARELLPLASLNSVTLLSAELVGRSYGGGILKIEPREADQWWMPSVELIRARGDRLRAIRPRVQRLLQAKRLLEAVDAVDAVLLGGVVTDAQLSAIRADRHDWMNRRVVRGKSG